MLIRHHRPHDCASAAIPMTWFFQLVSTGSKDPMKPRAPYRSSPLRKAIAWLAGALLVATCLLGAMAVSEGWFSAPGGIRLSTGQPIQKK
jgi:hypothetical protein